MMTIVPSLRAGELESGSAQHVTCRIALVSRAFWHDLSIASAVGRISNFDVAPPLFALHFLHYRQSAVHSCSDNKLLALPGYFSSTDSGV
jgi:hypothetical protein